jgi:hypothetical protein
MRNKKMQVKPNFEITSPPAKKTNNHAKRRENEGAREEIKNLLETMKPGQSFVVTGAGLSEILNLIYQLKINWGMTAKTTARTLNDGSVCVWIVE